MDRAAMMAATFWASWAVCLAVLAYRHPQGVFRPAGAYLVLFGLFHGGLLLSVAVRGTGGPAWLDDMHTPQAVLLAVLGMASFTTAAVLTASRVPPAEGPGSAVLGPLGVGVQLTGLGIFAAAVFQAGGADLLFGGYVTFVEANAADTVLAFGMLCAGVGAVLAVAAGGRSRVAGLAGLALYALVALPLGTRGEMLFPLLAVVVIEARRRRIRPMWTVCGLALTLLLIGLVQQTRIAGISALSATSWLTAPLDAVAEMGFSLRPTVEVLGWGEPLRNGETLLAVPMRLLESFTGLHGGPPVYDDRLFNVEIANRVGQIGGSPVAEAFHNFGTLGVLLFLGAVGALLGWLERRSDAVLGVVLLPLLIQVRDSFAPVPVQIAFGSLLVGAARVVGRSQVGVR